MTRPITWCAACREPMTRPHDPPRRDAKVNGYKGLCGGCYQRHEAAGTLDDFPCVETPAGGAGIEFVDQSWAVDAACARVDPDLWFPRRRRPRRLHRSNSPETDAVRARPDRPEHPFRVGGREPRSTPGAPTTPNLRGGGPWNLTPRMHGTTTSTTTRRSNA